MRSAASRISRAAAAFSAAHAGVSCPSSGAARDLAQQPRCGLGDQSEDVAGELLDYLARISV
jgi:hypothetical protein